MKAFLTAAGVLFVAGAAFASDARMVSSKGSELLAKYQPTGDTVSCLLLRQIDSMKFVEDSLILIETNGGKYYLNQTSNDCNGARGNRRIEYITTGSALCRNEIIRVVDNGSGTFMGSCSLGAFERLEEKTES